MPVGAASRTWKIPPLPNPSPARGEGLKARLAKHKSPNMTMVKIDKTTSLDWRH